MAPRGAARTSGAAATSARLLQVPGETVELVSQRAVIDQAADLGGDSTEQRLVDGRLKQHIALGQLLERGLQRLELAGVEDGGAGDFAANPSHSNVDQVA